MNKTNFRIWKNNDHQLGTLYREREIDKVVDLSGDTYFIVDIAPNKDMIDRLNSQINPEISYIEKEDLEAYLDSIGINADVKSCEDLEISKSVIVYERETNAFYDLTDFDTVDAVQYWDGHNWVWDYKVDDWTEETLVTVDDDSERCIDEWDGSNFKTGGMGLHEDIYKAIEVDGEDANDMYLLRKTSQWEGEQDTAEVMSREDLIDYLESIDRDPSEYLD